MTQFKWTWLAGSLILAGAYGCKSSQSSEELRGEPGGRQNEIGTCIAVCKTNDFFDCGTVAKPLTERGCKSFKLPPGEPPIPSFKHWRWVAGGVGNQGGNIVVDAPGSNGKSAIIENAELVCPLNRSETLYFDEETLTVYLDDYSKPSDFVATAKLSRARNMDPDAFSFYAPGKMRYGGSTRNPNFPKESSYIELELTRPEKRSVACHKTKKDAETPEPAVGVPIFVEPDPMPAAGVPIFD